MYSILILLQLCSILAGILASEAVLPKQVTGDSITGAKILLQHSETQESSHRLSLLAYFCNHSP
jgi:hypothetical protein